MINQILIVGGIAFAIGGAYTFHEADLQAPLRLSRLRCT